MEYLHSEPILVSDALTLSVRTKFSAKPANWRVRRCKLLTNLSTWPAWRVDVFPKHLLATPSTHYFSFFSTDLRRGGDKDKKLSHSWFLFRRIAQFLHVVCLKMYNIFRKSKRQCKCEKIQRKYIFKNRMRWFSHRRRSGRRHNCITYLLTDVVAWPTATPATPTSVCWFFA